MNAFEVAETERDVFGMIADAHKAARVESGAGNLIGSSYLYGGVQGYLGTGLTYETLIASYRGWVYTCVAKIANSVAVLPLELYVYRNSTGRAVRGSEVKTALRNIEVDHERRQWLKSAGLRREQVTEHPFLELLAKPNHLETRFMLWYNMMLRLELAGKCGVYLVPDRLGIPREMWVLPLTKSGVLKPIPDAKNVIGGFVYQDGGKREAFSMDEILFLRYPHPDSPFEGMSPLRAQTYPYDIDSFLEKHQYYLLKNRMHYGNVLGTEQNLKQSQVNTIKADLANQFRSVENTGKALILHSGLTLQDGKLGSTMKDLMVKEVEEFARDKLLSSYGVGAGKLGLVKDVNRANMEALNETFNAETIRPKVMMIEEMFETFVLPRYDEALTMDFNLPKRYDRENDIREREVNLRFAVTSPNEEREKMGLEPAEWGERPFIAWTQVPAGEGAPGADDRGVAKGTKAHKGGLTAGFWTKERRDAAWKVYIENHTQWEHGLILIVRDYFSGQAKRALECLRATYPKAHGNLMAFNRDKRRRVLAKKDLAAQAGLDRDAEERLLRDGIYPIVKGIMQEAGQWRLDMLGGVSKAVDVSIEYNINDTAALKWLGDRMDAFSREVTGTTFDEIDAILREGYQEGKPVTAIATDLTERFVSWEKWRAPMIARTETTAASNYADLDAVESAGLQGQLLKGWLPAGDEHTRDTHAVAGTQYENGIPLNDTFSVGADEMEAPGCGGLAEENINCRCALFYIERE
jgi:HK97 family phage portal protein